MDIEKLDRAEASFVRSYVLNRDFASAATYCEECGIGREETYTILVELVDEDIDRNLLRMEKEVAERRINRAISTAYEDIR